MSEETGMIQSKVIGLTGGIASGKSTVSQYLKDKGLPIVDADLVSRQVVEPGSKGLIRLEEAFGSAIIIEGQLDRKALRHLIFSDDDKRILLNSILHPIIHEEILHQLNLLIGKYPIVVFDAPLMLENNLKHMVDVLWLVSCSEEEQIRRVMYRDDSSEDEAKAIIAKQMSLKEKELLSDIILLNNDSIESLYKQIDIQLKSL
jgi:dephospho-CoA kinase